VDAKEVKVAAEAETKEGKEEEEKKEELEKKKAKTTTAKKKKASAVDPIARALLSQRAKLNSTTGSGGKDVPAPPRTATLAAPTSHNCTPWQIETIKVTALYTALSSGKKKKSSGTFLMELSQREWNNPRFGFIQPRHAHFAYFTALVDCYRRLLGVGALYLEKNDHTLRRTLTERAGSAALHVPETTDADRSALNQVQELQQIAQQCAAGVQSCLDQAALRSEHERRLLQRKRELLEQQQSNQTSITSAALVGAANKIDWHDFVVVETIDFPIDEVVELIQPPPPPPPPTLLPSKNKQDHMDQSSSSSLEESSSSDNDDDEEEEKIQVVQSYQPKVVSTQDTFTSNKSRTHIIDPITKKSIHVDDMTEHMRIQLLDPKWAAEKKRFLEKQKESNIVEGGDVIARNITSFAKKRGDIFGSSEEDLMNREADSKKRLEEANRIIWEQAQQQPQPRPSTTSSSMPPASSSSIAMTISSNPPLPPPPSSGTMLPASTPAPTHLSSHPKPGADSDAIAVPPAKKPRIEEDSATTNYSASGLPPPPPSATLQTMHPSPHVSAITGTTPSAQIPGVPLPQQPTPSAPEVSGLTSNSTHTEPKSSAAVDVNAIIPEEEYATANPQPITLSISIPNDPSYSSWGLLGQTLSITAPIKSKIKTIKQELQPLLGGNMPVNKMQLKCSNAGFLKDGLTLAYWNMKDGIVLDLIPKVRGGRK